MLRCFFTNNFTNNYFSMYNRFTRLARKHCSVTFTFILKILTTNNEAAISADILYDIHLHSQWVEIHVMAKNLIYKRYQTPWKNFHNLGWTRFRVYFFFLWKKVQMTRVNSKINIECILFVHCRRIPRWNLAIPFHLALPL